MKATTGKRTRWRFFVGLCCFGAMSAVLHAQTLSGADLVEALRGGGYVIVMRHAASPRARPEESAASPGNIDRALLVLCVAVLAAIMAVRVATRVDPAAALRYE